eukprot:scaffold281135_cov21-Prasinocladus_malaysianus.AAC.1
MVHCHVNQSCFGSDMKAQLMYFGRSLWVALTNDSLPGAETAQGGLRAISRVWRSMDHTYANHADSDAVSDAL